MAQAKPSLINRTIKLRDLLFEEAQIKQMCGFKAAKPMQSEIVVIGNAGPKLAE